MDAREVRWGEGHRRLLRAAREISRGLGHHEIVCPLHLLLGMLLTVRPASLAVGEPDWGAVREAMREFAPPWGDELVVLSPGGQTPTTKRVLERAVALAADAGEAVEVEHVWDALGAAEPALVRAVLSRLGLATGADPA